MGGTIRPYYSGWSPGSTRSPETGRARASMSTEIAKPNQQVQTPHSNKSLRQPRPGRWLGEQNDAVLKQSLLNAGIIGGAGGPPVVLALPEADRAFIDAQCRPKRPLGQPSQNPRGAELAPCDEVLAVSDHGNLCWLVTRHMAPPRWRSRSV